MDGRVYARKGDPVVVKLEESKRKIIGAGSGAAAGTAIGAIVGGSNVKVRNESELTFTLDRDVTF